MDLKTFIQKYGEKFSSMIDEKITPVYNPLAPPAGADVYDGRIKGLYRKLFPVQGEVVKGIAKALYADNRKHLFVCGEMGTGKTTIAISAAAMSGKPLRILTICPTHLVEKWIREAKEIIPHVSTVDLTVKGVISILEEFRRGRQVPKTFEIHVMSKEKAKLGYGWRPAVWAKGPAKAPHCPDCGQRIMLKDAYATVEALSRSKCKCQECGCRLWRADGSLKRYAPAEYIKKYLKGYYDLIILDEIQDFKAGDSLQGRTMGALMAAADKCLCLTGTLNGGYADDLFHLLFRMAPDQLKRDGFSHDGVHKWLETYGTLETVKKLEEEDTYYGRGKRSKELVRRKPGVSPVVIGKHLLDKSCFIRLADVMEGLPPYEENVVNIKLGEQAEDYKALSDSLRGAIRVHGTRSMSAMFQSLLSYPDSSVLFGEEISIKNKYGEVVDTITAPLLSVSGLLPKEKELISIVKKEKAEGRKVLCYVTFTNTRDIRPRIREVLERNGFSVVTLEASVSPKKRESWIEKNTGKADVLLVNAELVKTGLDLYDFPTVVFYQTGYNIFTLRQAARRSWRIGQTEPVRVFFLCYEHTMQEMAITLVAKKLETALMVEGDLPEGLAEYGSTGGSVMEEMGKALVNNGAYLGAEQAWSAFRKKEIETQLGLGGKETIFSQAAPAPKRSARTAEKKADTTSIMENVTVRVTIVGGKTRKKSTVEVKHGDLDKVLGEGRMAQFALF